MPELIDNAVFEAALDELRRKSRLKLYQHDFDAWAWDVLRLKNYEKMRGIAHDALFAPKERTLVKSGNGTGKSVLEAEMILWAGSVFPEGETVSIISAPSIPQLQKVTFAYLKSFHGRVSEKLLPKDFKIPGHMDENLGWVSETKNGKIWLASGRKPPDQDAVSMFQGLRSQFGMTYVWFDEAGGMAKAMYTAAEAVMTGEDARFFGIGNPDNAGTDFQANFDIPEKAAEFNLHTISVYDTPIFTGERVYPHTREGDKLETQMRKALTGKRWVAHKSRIWATGGEVVPDMDFMDPVDPTQPDRRYFHRVSIADSPIKWDARGLSKVLGEFPGDNDSAFFPQSLITSARAKDMGDVSGSPCFLGVDIARFGSDESVAVLNQGGRVRVIDTWGKTDTVESARRVHKLAKQYGVAEVRIDASGVGGGVFDMLKGETTPLAEFADRVYPIVGIDGGSRSPDNRRWKDARAFNHDTLRTLMAEDAVDLDFDDEELKEQLTNLTYKFTAQKGAIQITAKDEMRTEMNGSPDRLDAVIYAVANTVALLEAQRKPGDDDEIVLMDPFELANGLGDYHPWWGYDSYPL